MERILITGATGLLGYWLVKASIERGCETYAIYNKSMPVIKEINWIKTDITSFDEIKSLSKKLNPDIIIHAAAFTDVDKSEKEKETAYKINVVGTLNLVKSFKYSKFVYISTDYVFDGEKGYYKEEDIPNPVNFYGLTKLLGEEIVKTQENFLIIRTSGIYGYSPIGKKNFGINVLESLLKNQEVKAAIDYFYSPSYAEFLAERIIETSLKEILGLLHIAGERKSRYEFASELAKLLNKEGLVISTSFSDLKLEARRPKDSSLNTDRAKSLGLELPDLKKCLKRFIEVYYADKKLEET